MEFLEGDADQSAEKEVSIVKQDNRDAEPAETIKEDTLKPMTATEIAQRQSLKIINDTIQALCVQRDLIVSQLPNAPKRKVLTHLSNGMEIKPGGGKRRKRVAGK